MLMKVNLKRLYYISCFLFVFTLPFPIPVNNIAIVFLLLTWILQSSWQQKALNLRDNKHGYWIFVLFAVYSFSMVYSASLVEGLQRLETKLSLIGISLVIFSSTLSKEEIKSIFLFFVCSNLLVGIGLILMASVRFINSGNGNVFFYHELTSPIGLHAIYFANYLCFGIFILIFNSEDKLKLHAKVLLILLSLLLIAMLSALLVIGFLILAFVVAVSVYLSTRTNLFRTIFTSISFLAVLGFLLLLVPRTREKILQINRLDYRMDDPDYAWNTVTLRLAIWTCALPVTLEKPILGVGIGDENDALQTSYTKHNFKEGIRCNYNTHNQYLSTCIAIGFVGLLILLGMICVPAIKAFSQKDWLAFAFLSLIGFSFFTENILSVQKGVVFFSFFYSLLLKKDIISHS
ncbi:MAG: hypothetical protein EWV86_03340 [Microcystis panniformis Mp_MB_F_20051200_S9D]|nr:MAG: hypothetical protein EWV86_03340 [Microcystis panniformis Mp_MB_F_20051200_S9D]